MKPVAEANERPGLAHDLGRDQHVIGLARHRPGEELLLQPGGRELQRSKRSFDAPFRLRNVGTDDVNVQLQRARD